MDIQGLIKAWLKDNQKILSIRAIEDELNMPPDTLQKVMQGKRKLPEKWITPYLKFIDRITEQWLFPFRKYRQFVKWEKDDIFSDHYRDRVRKGKRRTDDVPKFDIQLHYYFESVWEFQRKTLSIIKLIKELEPNIDSLQHEFKLSSIHAAAKVLLELTIYLESLGIKNEEVEQSTEIYE